MSDQPDASEDVGHVYRGINAELSVVRAAASNPDALRIAIQQYMDPIKQEVLLHSEIPARVSLLATQDSDADVDAASHEELLSLAAAATSSFSHVPGFLVVTSERIMFWAEDEAKAAFDFAIDATCIELHALQEDPEMGVYIQAQDNDADEDAAPLELTVVPAGAGESGDQLQSHAIICQALFDALCKLVSMHPVDLNENDDDPFKMTTGGQDDAMMFYSAFQSSDSVNGPGATPDEREQMLQRLDQMLVVPPELDHLDDQDEGQFSDADENVL